MSKPADGANVGRLVTASCTTGWCDWIHGELWLLPTGLLRVSSGLGATMEHGNQQTVAGEPIERAFGPGEIEHLHRQHRTNVWIPAEMIVAAAIRSGLLCGRLSLTIAGGGRIKLLWLRADPAGEPLKQALTSWGIPV